MDELAERLIALRDQIGSTSLPDGAVEGARRSFVDSVGCAIGAVDSEPVRALMCLAAEVTAARPSTVFGTSVQTAVELAALVNGAMVRYLDYSDDYFASNDGSGPHPSDNVAGLLALSESRGFTGDSFVTAMAIAYEVCGQLVRHYCLQPFGWDYPIFHSIASSLAASHLLELDPPATRSALGLAVVPNVSLGAARRGQLSHWKGLAGPNGSRNGIFAALLAEAGVTGPERPLDGPGGLVKQLDVPTTLGDSAVGTRLVIEEAYYKSRPVRYGWQLPTYMGEELHGRVLPEDIESLLISYAARYVVDPASHPEYWSPSSRETADHSGPFLVAAAIVDGEVNLETFSSSRFLDPRILSVMQAIRMVEDPEATRAFPGTFRCRMTIRLRDGSSFELERENPKGHPANPLSNEELGEKFISLTSPSLGDDRAREALDHLWSIAEIARLREIFPLLEIAPDGTGRMTRHRAKGA